MAFSGTASVGAVDFHVMGLGQTTTGVGAVLAEVDLTYNERAAIIEASAISGEGVERRATAIAWMVPEQGWSIHASGDGCRLDIEAGKTLVFVVSGGEEASWAGRVAMRFTQDYVPT